jgi:hypothetical protein
MKEETIDCRENLEAEILLKKKLGNNLRYPLYEINEKLFENLNDLEDYCNTLHLIKKTNLQSKDWQKIDF